MWGGARPVPGATLPARYIWIDGLRGIAALAVVIFHYHHFFIYAGDRSAVPPPDGYPLAGLLLPVYSHGHLAVQLFWVISGFVFAHIYVRRHSTLAQFARARFARLYPLHFATLLTVAVLQLYSMQVLGVWQVYGNNDLRHFVLQLFMASNWSTQSRGLSFNGPIWSVSVEIAVYAAFFLSLRLVRWRSFGAALALACLSLWIALGPLHSEIRVLTTMVFICGGYFFAGAAIWAAVASRPILSALPRVLLAVGLMAGVMVGLGKSDDALLIGATMLMVAGLSWAERLPLRVGGPVLWLGDLSYAIYLVHVPIQMLALLVLAPWGRPATGIFYHPAALVLFLAATLWVAHVAHYRFERPAGRWLRRVGGTSAG